MRILVRGLVLKCRKQTTLPKCDCLESAKIYIVIETYFRIARDTIIVNIESQYIQKYVLWYYYYYTQVVLANTAFADKWECTVYSCWREYSHIIYKNDDQINNYNKNENYSHDRIPRSTSADLVYRIVRENKIIPLQLIINNNILYI